MYTQSVRLGSIRGIPIGVNYSWFIVFALITLSLTTQFTHLHPEWTFVEQLVFGVTTSLLFFASVLLHELGHSIVALHFRIPVQSITLFIFGGVAAIAREPEKPLHEFYIAVAGPLVSALLGVGFYVLEAAALSSFEGLATLGAWLGYINLILAGFNLIPGFPLDGGRILRSIVWKVTGSYTKASSVAAGVGQFVAYGFILYGVWIGVGGNLYGGIWIAFIGWFLLNAAQATSARTSLRESLGGLHAVDVMSSDCSTVDPDLAVSELVETHLLKSGARCSMVTSGERLLGIVTLHEIKELPRHQWTSTPVRDIMISDDELMVADPNTPVDLILDTMNRENVNQIPVVEGERLVGVIGRDRLLAIVQTRLELKQ